VTSRTLIPRPPDAAAARRRARALTSLLLAAAAGLGAGSPARAAAAAAATPAAAATAAKAAPSLAPRTVASPLLSADQAGQRAKASAKPVVATALTTETSLTTANPDGTTTVTRSAEPTRIWRDGGWIPLDATLVRNADGTISPKATPGSLVLSGGGSRALAALNVGGRQLSLTLPVALPAPTLSGPTATYAGVLPGVNLVVTATAEGAFSDVVVIGNATAAADPRLADLLDAATSVSKGLAVRADAAGNVTVADAAGHAVFTAPAPLAWDSADSAGSPAAGAASAAVAGRQAVSNAAGPGATAHVTVLKVGVRQGGIALAPPTALLTAQDTKFPVMVDPWYTPNYGADGWATVPEYYPSSNYWDNTPDPSPGTMQVGNSGTMWSRTLMNFPVPSGLEGADITAASVGITQTYASACTAEQVNLYAPSSTLTSGDATWNHWVSSFGSVVASATEGYGHSSSCPASAVSFGGSSVLSTITSDVSSGKTVQTFGLVAADESDPPYGWKEFSAASAFLSVTYDHTPDAPQGLYTSPTTACGADTVLGDGSVTLYAPASDPDGDSLASTFDLYRTSDPGQTNLLTSSYGVASDQATSASGQTAVLALTAADMTAMSTVGGVLSPTEFSWKAESSDGTLTGSWSSTCNFTFSASAPAAPVIVPTSSPVTGSTCPVANGSAPTIVIGTLCSFTITTPTGTAPGSYTYQVDEAAPVTVAAGATSPYTAVIAVTMPRSVNTLQVYGLAAGTNHGPVAGVTFDGAAPSTSTDGDLTGDGTPDLVTTGDPLGSGNAIPPGLWLAPGGANGSVGAAPTDIGADGLGFNLPLSSANPTSASDWNGAQAITGAFCGTGDQDVLAYFPTRADLAGGGEVMCGNETASPLSGAASGGAPFTLLPQTFQDSSGDNATQLADAYNTSAASTGHPDLFATIGNTLYLFTSHSANGYSDDGGWGCSQDCDELGSTLSPDGSLDWSDWTIATTQLSSGTAMYLWNPGSGDLDLWTGVTLSGGTYPNATTLTPAHSYAIDTGWTSPDLQLHAFAQGSVPGLWATNTATGVTTSHIPAGLVNDPALSGVTTTPTVPADHWPLDDAGVGQAASSTTDQITDAATGTAPVGVTETSDPYRQTTVADLTGSGYLTLPSSLISQSTTQTVTLSFQTTTANSSGILLSTGHAAPGSLNATATPVMYIGTDGKLYAQFATGTVEPIVSGAPVNDGEWHTATLAGAGTTQTLYLDGSLVGTVTGTITDTDPDTFAGAGVFNTLGWVNAPGSSGTVRASYFTGNLADIQYSPTAPPGVLPSVPAHSWALNNGTSGTVTSAADTGDNAPLPLSGASGITWNTGDQFSPDVKFSNAATAPMSTSGPALAFGSSNMTISVWAKPAALGGVMASQDGAESSGMIIYPDNVTGNWYFCLSTSDTNAWSYNCAVGPAVQLNVWTQVTGTYNATSGAMSLYINGALAGTATHTAVAGFTGPFRLGTYLYDSTLQGLYVGQLADVQTWNSVQIPVPAPAHQWLLDEGSGSAINDSIGGLGGYVSESGSTWSGTSTAPSLGFDGSSGYAETNGNAVNTAGSYTVSAWADLSSLPGGNATVLSEPGTNNSPFYLQYNGGAWAFVIGDNDTASPTLDGPSGPATVAANTWYHLVGVYNAGTQTAKLYVNGSLVGTQASLPDFSSAGDLDIGRDLYTGLEVDYFPGQIRNVETWNKVLTAAQVSTLG
jgi:Concanavalin A-like lectin/glucanases superfamily